MFVLALVCRWHACFFNNQRPVENNCFVAFIHADELCDSMAIGQLYRVIGIPAHVHQWPGSTCSVEANTVRLLEPECKYLMRNVAPLRVTAFALIQIVTSRSAYN